LLVMEIMFQVRLEACKSDLENIYGFDMRRSFKAIDINNNNSFNESELRRFLKRVGHQPVKKELVAIIRRFDMDGDARISYEEYVEALTPVVPDVLKCAV